MDRLPFLGVKWLFWNRNLKTIPSEHKDILYLILKVLNRPLKWDSTSLNSSWIGLHQPSKLNVVRFSSKTEVFFEHSTLTACIFGSSWSSVLNRPLKWGTARLWTPTGFKNTSRQSWTFEKNLCFSTKTEVFFKRSTLTAGIFESSGSSETCCTSF